MTATTLSSLPSNHRPSWPHEIHKHRSRSRGFAAPPIHACGLVTVTAHLETGFIRRDAGGWPLLLDGILCHVERRAVRGVRPGQWDRHIPDLPIAVFFPRNRRNFVWIASCATWDGDRVEPTQWGRRADIQFFRRHGYVGRVNTSTGPDKSTWTTDQKDLAGIVTWRCVGLADVIAEWLTVVPALGARKGRGEGRILDFSVHSEPVPSSWLTTAREAYGHALRWVCEPRGGLRVARPLHPSYAEIIGHPGDTILGAYRPPYIPEHATSVGRRHAVEVLAP